MPDPLDAASYATEGSAMMDAHKWTAITIMVVIAISFLGLESRNYSREITKRACIEARGNWQDGCVFTMNGIDQ